MHAGGRGWAFHDVFGRRQVIYVDNDPQSNRASPLFSSTEPAERPAAESSSAGSSTEFP